MKNARIPHYFSGRRQKTLASTCWRYSGRTCYHLPSVIPVLAFVCLVLTGYLISWLLSSTIRPSGGEPRLNVDNENIRPEQTTSKQAGNLNQRKTMAWPHLFNIDPGRPRYADNQTLKSLLGQIEFIEDLKGSKVSHTLENDTSIVILLSGGIPAPFRELGSFRFVDCPVSSCYLADKLRLRRDPLLKDRSHDAVLLSRLTPLGEVKHLCSKRRTRDVWIFSELESADYFKVDLDSIYGNECPVNWTATYRRDSTIPSQYGQFVSQSMENIPGESTRSVTGTTKNRLLAWFASNCNTTNNRMGFVRELRKYIPVDIYGECGELKCEKRPRCMEMLRQQYKFYFSLENSNCREYITEKFFLNAIG